MIDGKPYFPAKECAEILGYSKARNAIDRHCKGALKRGVPTNGGEQEKTFIPEGDLYRLIIRSKLPEAVRFEQFVCDEVLPSIRKTGAYITDELLERLREDERYINELLNRLINKEAENELLTGRVEEMYPKARYCDMILLCSGAIQTSIIAKEYGLSCVAFNKLLNGLKVQYKIGSTGTWLLYQKYAGKGYTVSRTY